MNATVSQLAAPALAAVASASALGCGIRVVNAVIPAGSGGAGYLAMERHNADAIVRGFTAGRSGCAIPGR
jgi:hypothetical protein